MKTLERVAEFHGHMCPGLAIGYRVSALALRELGDRAGDEELVALVENDSCAVDAVQVVTGCTFGKGNLVFRDYGKQVYTFIRRPSGEALRISVKWVPPPEGDEEKTAWERYMKGDRSEGVRMKVHERKSARINAVMSAPEGELFDIKKIQADAPPVAGIYPSVRCELCGEKVMEPRARLLEGKIVCMPCLERGAKTA
jgi:formylmethanofuran dehydrogenase subunit E